MARSDEQANIRLPLDLKEALKTQAVTNSRSLNGEIAHRLRASFGKALSKRKEQPEKN